MNFFAKIAAKAADALGIGGKAGGSSAPERLLSDLNHDHRVHARYALDGFELASIVLDNGLHGAVRDLSYGGLAVCFNEHHLNMPLGQQFIGTLRVLDRAIKACFCPIRIANQDANTIFVGCTLIHETAETLVFLRDAIEPMRCGQSLTLLAADMRNQRYRSPDWLCFRGDGPSDLTLRTANGKIAEGMLTFRSGDSYCELIVSDGRLKTGRSNDLGTNPLHAGAQMSSTQDLDKMILRHAACVFSALPAAHRQDIRPVLEGILRELNGSKQKV